MGHAQCNEYALDDVDTSGRMAKGEGGGGGSTGGTDAWRRERSEEHGGGGND